jgi:hypothetical protein
MKNKKRLALQVGLVAVIIYLWLNRSRKKKAIAEAKAGAGIEAGAVAKSDAKPVADNSSKIITSSPAEECGSPSNQPTGNLGQVEQTISLTQSSANFSGSNGQVIKGKYFR